MEQSQQLSYQSITTNPGIYLFLDEDGTVLYVGKAKNLKKRVSSYFLNKNLEPKTEVLVSKIKQIKTLTAESEIESLLLEANLIKKYSPRYNIKLTDGKNYPSVKISIKDTYPKVLFIRKQDDPEAVYFGPFPSSTDLKMVLKLIRKIFPYQSVQNHPKKHCLYYHINLCPCPPMFKTLEEEKDYKKNISYIIKFFEGNKKGVLKDLEAERDNYSKKENFESARIIQKKIDAINSITASRNNPFDYEINPNLRSDLRNKELNELEIVLKENGVNIKTLKRIECYDISNISGKFATGSMVVLTNGEIDKSQYRRFQIKRPPIVVPNDFAMMREVIKRRLAHPEWGEPGLIVVDGGKGQISSAQKTLFEMDRTDIPLIGIAKREELLITSNFKVIKLPRNSDALILVRRIRDEAHRFAITYHKKLRSKFIFG